MKPLKSSSPLSEVAELEFCVDKISNRKIFSYVIRAQRY